MKICVISTTVIPCPPAGYAGLEMISWLCANGLKDKGHDVLLIAPKGSSSKAEIHETTLMEQEKQAYSGYWERLPKYDVIIIFLPAEVGLATRPVIAVLHAVPVNCVLSALMVPPEAADSKVPPEIFKPNTTEATAATANVALPVEVIVRVVALPDVAAATT